MRLKSAAAKWLFCKAGDFVEFFEEACATILIVTQTIILLAGLNLFFGPNPLVQKIELPLIMLLAILSVYELDWIRHRLWCHEIEPPTKLALYGCLFCVVFALFLQSWESYQERLATEYQMKTDAHNARIREIQKSDNYKRGVEVMTQIQERKRQREKENSTKKK